ncbi:MAG: ROK family protein [Anaerolineales bacterium]|jgi:fructokinase
MTLFAGIEAGGTKFICALGKGPAELYAKTQIPTTTPEETFDRVVEFFTRQTEPFTAVGIGSFGPLDLNPISPTYGHITSTPKPGWQNVNIVARIQGALGVPVGFDTDVNAAALGEQRWGAAQGLDTFIYLTVGTGIGGGAMVAGELLHGLMHPEMGHMRVPHDRDRDPFDGICPFHQDCLEGLASGPAIVARWGQRGQELFAEHPAWELEAQYLAYGLVSQICILSPERIILGGGVMARTHLFPKVRAKTLELLNGYLQVPAILEQIDSYVVPPKLGDQAGVLGAIALAQKAYQEQHP